MAADHIDSLRLSLLQDQQLAPAYAIYSLLRGAVESAATACWLVFPEDSETRRLRALRVGHHEAKDLETYKKVQREQHPDLFEPSDEPPQTTASKELLGRLGFNPDKDRLTYLRIMQDVDLEIGDVPGRAWWFEIENCWRLCSAMAHGRGWAQSTVLTMDIVAKNEASQSVTARFRPSIKWLAWATVQAVAMMDLALTRAEQLGKK